MPNTDDPVTRDNQIAVHQAGQALNNNIPDVGCKQVQTLPVEITEYVSIAVSSACTVLA
jgi:hypothetical protein